MQKTYHSLSLNNHHIDYHITQKRGNKHLRMRISAYDGLQISAPMRMPKKYIVEFITQHKQWILNNYYQKNNLKNDINFLPQYIDLKAIKKSYNIIWRQNLNKYITINNNNDDIIIHGKNIHHYKKSFPKLKNFMRNNFYHTILEKLQYHADICHIPFQSLRLAWQKSRWGSCSYDGHIALNVALLFCPPEWLDYVIIHELCHVRYHNHGADFKKLLYNMCHDSLKIERDMKTQNQQYLPSWLFYR